MVKSIIDIDVNDQAFKQFNALFQQYTKQLKGMPLAWRQIAIAQAGGVKGFQDLVKEQAIAIGQQRLMEQAHKSALNLLRAQETIWQNIRRQTTGVAVNIRDMTTEFAHWAKVTGAISGLLGVGGLFGIERLAQGVSSERRSALGLGVTYGQQKAFGNAFERFADPGALLEGVEGARTDPTKRVALMQAGVTDFSGNSFDIAQRALLALQRKAKEGPEEFLGTRYGISGAGQLGLSEGQFRALRRYSPEELAQNIGRAGGLAGQYNVSDEDQKAYEDLQQSLKDAGNQIEVILVKGLAKLAPGIGDLSASVVKTIKELTESVPPETMQNIGKGIESLGKYLGSEDFQNNIKAFAGGVQWVAEKFISLGIWSSGKSTSVAMGTASAVATSIFNPAAAYGTGASGPTWGVGGNISVKPGAGTINPRLYRLISGMQNTPGGFNRITAAEDHLHEGWSSAHNDGRAFDFTLNDPSMHAEAKKYAQDWMRSRGIRGRVIDEYDPAQQKPGRTTAPHIHVQVDAKIEGSCWHESVRVW